MLEKLRDIDIVEDILRVIFLFANLDVPTCTMELLHLTGAVVR